MLNLNRYGEIVERVFACRKYKKGDKQVVKITEVIRRDTSGRTPAITKNMTYSRLGGYSPQYERRDRFIYGYYKTFAKEWFDKWYDIYDNFLPPDRVVVNADILPKIEEFKYCSYRSGDVIAYLKAYRKHKGVEFIGKLDLPLSKAIINKCEKDKGFKTYLYKHHDKVNHYGVRVFIYAYNHNLTFEQASAKLRGARNENFTKAFAEATAKAKRLIYSEGGLTIFPPNSPADLVIEGDALSHCVGRMGYDKKMVNGTSYIMFVREINAKDTPYVTVEYDPKGQRILQSYGAHNTKPNEACLKFLDNWVREIAV